MFEAWSIVLCPLFLSLGLLEEYCQEPCDLDDEHPELLTKFSALLVASPVSLKLRKSIVEHCGVSNFDVLQMKVQDIVGEMEWREEAAPLFSFCELLSRAQLASVSDLPQPFPDFFERIYPCYLSAIVSQEDYYLSDLELIALCKCTNTNSVVFKHDIVNASLEYLRSHIADRSAPLVLTSIRVHPEHGAVRSHFERVVVRQLPSTSAIRDDPNVKSAFSRRSAAVPQSISQSEGMNLAE